MKQISFGIDYDVCISHFLSKITSKLEKVNCNQVSNPAWLFSGCRIDSFGDDCPCPSESSSRTRLVHADGFFNTDEPKCADAQKLGDSGCRLIRVDLVCVDQQNALKYSGKSVFLDDGVLNTDPLTGIHERDWSFVVNVYDGMVCRVAFSDSIDHTQVEAALSLP